MDKNYDHLINSKDWKDRYNLAENGIALDQLVHDKSWFVRAAVVRQKYALDILVKDESWRVRLEVAKQNYGLEILVNDEREEVRKEAKLRLETLSAISDLDTVRKAMVIAIDNNTTLGEVLESIHIKNV